MHQIRNTDDFQQEEHQNKRHVEYAAPAHELHARWEFCIGAILQNDQRNSTEENLVGKGDNGGGKLRKTGNQKAVEKAAQCAGQKPGQRNLEEIAASIADKTHDRAGQSHHGANGNVNFAQQQYHGHGDGHDALVQKDFHGGRQIFRIQIIG